MLFPFWDENSGPKTCYTEYYHCAISPVLLIIFINAIELIAIIKCKQNG